MECEVLLVVPMTRSSLPPPVALDVPGAPCLLPVWDMERRAGGGFFGVLGCIAQLVEQGRTHGLSVRVRLHLGTH